MFKLGRQRPLETDVPPPAIAPPPLRTDTVAGIISGNPQVPPTYVYTQRREPHMGPSFLMAPDDNSQQMYDLGIAWQEAPDPIRQSDFFADGNKVHPDAQMRITSHLAIGSREAVAEDSFRIGKLLGYIHRPMYAGRQQPSVIRSNIAPAVPTTYGSEYIVQGVQPAGGVETATGFAVSPLGTSSSVDGYPY